jgi:hypothetical protein
MPLPLIESATNAINAADQDRERQRQNRDAVHQIHQIGLGGRQHSDDLGDGLLECDPLIAGDERARDHCRQEHRCESEPEDVIGAPGQRLQQAA